MDNKQVEMFGITREYRDALIKYLQDLPLILVTIQEPVEEPKQQPDVAAPKKRGRKPKTASVESQT